MPSVRQLINGLFLTAIIAVAVFVCGTVVMLHFEPQNSLTLKIRGDLVLHPLLRTMFSLHNDGDGASDYLGPKTTRIAFNVYSMPSVEVDDQALDAFATSVQSVTGKPVSMNITGEGTLPDDNPIADSLLPVVLGPYSTPESTVSNEAQLNVFILSADADTPDELGSTYRENGVILYEGGLTALVSNEPAALEPYEASTLLHEFGHQIGLQHNAQPGCLMNPSVDVSNTPDYNTTQIPVSFCPYELNQIAAEVASYR